jgi:brefeldin A-inhibited guanine nucleotide-exchange protein
MKLESAAGTNKKLLFDKEREGILRRGTGLLKQDNKNNRFVLIKDISTIRPMFENTWSANLAVFSVVLDETEDPIIADLCLQGFMHAVRISGHFEIHDVRNAFVSSLSKFTQVSASKEIKQKNINCIRELLNLAIHNGDCLRDSWSYVLECISKIDHMRVLGLGDLTDSEYFKSEAGAASQGQALNQQLLMRNSAIIAEQIDANQIETIFLQSERLNTDAIIDFIENLCRVSKEELADEDSPKKFCLQKLVEVASLNMNRVRFQWQSIWTTLGEHFTWVGSRKNLHVVIYAIDSLRQLADKFLEKEERKNFSYQKMFLKPFETIMLNNLHSR